MKKNNFFKIGFWLVIGINAGDFVSKVFFRLIEKFAEDTKNNQEDLKRNR